MQSMTEADKIKIALFKKIAKEIKGNYIAVPEVSLPGSVADMLVTNGDIHIYEIKSKADSLSRIKKQIESYKKHAHRVTIVADSKFIQKLKEAPYMEGVGLIEVTSRYQLNSIDEAYKNNNVYSENYLAYWAPIEIRETLRGFPGWYKYDTSEAKAKLLDLLSEDELRRLTIFRIKQKYEEEFWKRMDMIESKGFKEALSSRFDDLGKLRITPLLDIPVYVFREFF